MCVYYDRRIMSVVKADELFSSFLTDHYDYMYTIMSTTSHVQLRLLHRGHGVEAAPWAAFLVLVPFIAYPLLSRNRQTLPAKRCSRAMTPQHQTVT